MTRGRRSRTAGLQTRSSPAISKGVGDAPDVIARDNPYVCLSRLTAAALESRAPD